MRPFLPGRPFNTGPGVVNGTSASERTRRPRPEFDHSSRAVPVGQCLVSGLVDEMEINLVPTLLGSGERLFEGLGDDLHGLELVRTVATPKVTHLKFARR
ncbi:MAG: hypothetical protein E6J65_14215 [Deltaproteobacteria bacterium]|nr:MAG: hypothetical protein E6J63_23675 [Deltaproteobacteria bacterium]TMB22984.1 MAG: hypothetical protein E6J65_14215 [Deltaproteobacteria bacterium]